MYIEPSTNIYFLKDCPLESSYDHTLWFDKVADQTDYFKSLIKYRIPKNTYQRKDRGYMKVQLPVENLYDCNYIMFQNEKFGNKWFYAFLTNQEYVSNDVSMVRYSLDVMQTWFFDYKLNECFVEREHVADDTFGLHTVPEKLDIGEYEHHFLDKDPSFSWEQGDFVVGVITVYDRGGEQNANQAGMYGGVYSGLNILYFEPDSQELQDWISTVVDNNGEDGIIAMYMIPRDFIIQKGDGVKETNQAFDVHEATDWTYEYGDGTEKKTGPRNNKLYTYPFNLLVVDTMAGQDAEFRVEFLKNKNLFNYKVEGVMGAPPQVGFIPKDYNGVDLDRTEMLVLDAFPQCAFVTDSYRAWVAMNYRTQNVAGATNVANGLLGTVGSLARGNPMGALTNIVGSASNIAMQLAQWNTAETLPNRAHGELASTLPMANDTLGFNLYNMHIRPEYARIIDDYFDRYGYAVHTQKVPNRNVRPHWTFTKTVNCTITGSVPNDDMSKIIAIYNRGITFWKKGSEVGNYTLDNKPTGSSETDAKVTGDYFFTAEGRLSDYSNAQKNNALAVYNTLNKKGWSNMAIFAMLGNLQSISSINPTYYEADGDKYGLIRWSPKSNYTNWAAEHHFSSVDGFGQLEWIDTMPMQLGYWDFDDPPYNVGYHYWTELKDKDLEWMVRCLEHNMFGARQDEAEIQKRIRQATTWQGWLTENNYLKPEAN